MAECYDFNLMKQLMAAKDSGEGWVRYSDYDALYEENKRLRRALEQIEQQLDYGQIDMALRITRSALERDEYDNV